MTQLERIAKALREHGKVRTTDFCTPPVLDGGPPILRVAARIENLKKQGWRIVPRRLMNNTCEYVLLSPPAEQPGSARTDEDGRDLSGAGIATTSRSGGDGQGQEGSPATTLFDETVGAAPPVDAAREDYEAA